MESNSSLKIVCLGCESRQSIRRTPAPAEDLLAGLPFWICCWALCSYNSLEFQDGRSTEMVQQGQERKAHERA